MDETETKLEDGGITPGEAFVIDDDFDPLEDMALTDYDEEGDANYLTPIPDADKSVVPPKVNKQKRHHQSDQRKQ